MTGENVISCPECGTRARVGSLEEAVEKAENHNEKAHDGENTAKVNGIPLPSDELVGAAEDFFEKVNG